MVAALFKTKEGATQADVDRFLTAAKGMLDQIPCLLSIETGKATGLAAKFGQGFEWGVVATLDKLESLPVYESHPAHRPYVLRLVTLSLVILCNCLAKISLMCFGQGKFLDRKSLTNVTTDSTK